MKNMALALTALLALTACGASELASEPDPSPTPIDEPSPTEPVAQRETEDAPEFKATEPEPVGCPTDGTTMEVDTDCFEEEWPLTVDSGVLECIRGSAVVIHTPEGTFAVNGMAETWEEGESIDPIWRDNDSGMGGPKVNMKPLIDAGLDLC